MPANTMEGITISKIIDIIAEEVALDPKMIHEEDLLCDCDADSQDIFNILTTMEETFQIKYPEKDKIEMSMDEKITVDDIICSIDRADILPEK